jgi:beta-galactosidase
MTTLPNRFSATVLIKAKSANPPWSEHPNRGPIGPSSMPPETPAFYRAHFILTTPGDTFLDVRALGKGALWINGHAIGRFWNIGPQQTLFVPGPWLREGANEIVVFDLQPSAAKPHVAGLATPILDGPVTDTSPISIPE